MLCFLAIFALPNLVYAQMIGGAPSIIDLGEVERGKEYGFDVFLSMIGREVAYAQLSWTPIDVSMYGKVPVDRERCSDQRAGEVRFFEDVIEVPIELRDFWHEGRLVRAGARTTAILSVPVDSEPGCHVGRVTIKPIAPPGTLRRGQAVTIVAGAMLHLVYRVEGDAIRSGRIIGFASRTLHDRVIIRTVFENNGTLTLRAQPAIALTRGDEEIERNGLVTYVKPGEVAELLTHFPLLEQGLWSVRGTVSWTTGKETAVANITIAPPPPRPVPLVVRPVPVRWEVYALIALILIAIGWKLWRRRSY